MTREASMMNATKIYSVLSEKQGRYFERVDTLWLMREANGDAVTAMENGEEYPVIAAFIWLDDLTLQGLLIKDGSKYVLPSCQMGRADQNNVMTQASGH
jgi:hypothetical protein